jgi:hypothetical protein
LTVHDMTHAALIKFECLKRFRTNTRSKAFHQSARRANAFPCSTVGNQGVALTSLSRAIARDKRHVRNNSIKLICARVGNAARSVQKAPLLENESRDGKRQSIFRPQLKTKSDDVPKGQGVESVLRCVAPMRGVVSFVGPIELLAGTVPPHAFPRLKPHALVDVPQ